MDITMLSTRFYRRIVLSLSNYGLLHARKLCKSYKNERYSRYFTSSATGTDTNSSDAVKQPKRPLSSSYFITTPIYYVNAVPHIGHLYTSVLADAISRWYTLCGVPVIFSTGTDEHGLKIQRAAALAGKQPKEFCDEMSAEFKRLFQAADIRYTDFIRTTEPRHEAAVHDIWERLLSGGYIYKGVYEGWYSVSDEAFLTEDQITEGVDKQGTPTKVSAESGQPVEWMKEENYMFRLSQMAKPLSDWLDKGVIQPEKFEPLVRQFILDGLPDLSVSRSRARIPWGIPVPGDPTQTVYVWLDALVNYLTVGGFPAPRGSHWPADCHLVGKDIIRFHAVYWPAFLLAAGLEPPRRIQCHSHWLFNREKMSKSRGNVVDPFDRLARYSTDGLRYALLKDGVPHSDGNYTDERVKECINSDVVNTFGNLLSRCTGGAVNPDQLFPSPPDPGVWDRLASDAEKDMMVKLRQLPDVVDTHYRAFHTHRALDAVMTQLYRANAFVQDCRPWELVRRAAFLPPAAAEHQTVPLRRAAVAADSSSDFSNSSRVLTTDVASSAEVSSVDSRQRLAKNVGANRTAENLSLDCVSASQIASSSRESSVFSRSSSGGRAEEEAGVSLAAVLYVAMENLRVTAILLQPVMPVLAGRVLDRLGVDAGARGYIDAARGQGDDGRGGVKVVSGKIMSGRPLGPDQGPLLPRLK